MTEDDGGYIYTTRFLRDIEDAYTAEETYWASPEANEMCEIIANRLRD